MHRTQKDKLHFATDKDRKRGCMQYETEKYKDCGRMRSAMRQMSHKPYGG